MRVAIIGAGPCGLTCIKSCLDEGLEPVCFEKGGDLGGLWRYTATEDDHASVYKSCVMVTSKEMSCFSDFPMPKEYPMYLPHSLVKDYLDLYADHFGLRSHVFYNTKVLKVVYNQEANKNEPWKITYDKRFPGQKNADRSETFTEKFGAVLVASGHHWHPYVPKLPGSDKFLGKVIHSSSYREAKEFQDKNVLVIGLGESAAAIATELSQQSNKVYLSTRRGSWITSRLQFHGIPSDQFLQRRFYFDLPRKLLDSLCMMSVSLKFDHRNFGLLPSNSYLQQAPVVNDYLPYKILSGSVVMKPNVERITHRDVHFIDGSVAENLDVIILATGYNYTFPFLDENFVEFQDNSPILYKHMFRVEENPRIAFIGCLQPVGCMFSVAEIQARLATRVFKGLVTLPSTEGMRNDLTANMNRIKKEFYDAKKQATAVYFIPYCDEIAELIGCKPRLASLLLSDPHLALRCYFGPCSSPQYRLTGPGAWDGARQAIMEIHEKNIWQMSKKTNKKNFPLQIVVMTTVAILCLYFLFAYTAGKL